MGTVNSLGKSIRKVQRHYKATSYLPVGGSNLAERAIHFYDRHGELIATVGPGNWFRWVGKAAHLQDSGAEKCPHGAEWDDCPDCRH